MPRAAIGPVALLFEEPSTRTRVSFSEAIHRMGGWPVFLDREGSSLAKGESMEETLLNLAALGIQGAVIRTSRTGLPQELLEAGLDLWVVNAGDGAGEHPTQALGDTLTLMANGGLEGRRVAILGDVRHSRVARSLLALWPRLGVRLAILPRGGAAAEESVTTFSTMEEATDWAEVLYVLRPQVERWEKPLRGEALKKAMAPWRVESIRHGQFLMAPGPTWPGIDLAEGLLRSAGSLILDQVHWGLGGRMALMEELSLG